MEPVSLTEEEFRDEKTREGILKSAAKERASETERVFPRPKIRWARAFANVFGAAAVSVAAAVGAAFACPPQYALAVALSAGFGLPLLYALMRAKSVFLWLIDFYQAKAKESTRARCVFTPTCSEYARVAILRFGAWKGGYLAFRRLLRCHHPNGGFDPVPEKREQRKKRKPASCREAVRGEPNAAQIDPRAGDGSDRNDRSAKRG